MSNLNLSGCATTDLSHKSSKNVAVKDSTQSSIGQQYKIEQQDEQNNIKFESGKSKVVNQGNYSITHSSPTNMAATAEMANNL